MMKRRLALSTILAFASKGGGGLLAFPYSNPHPTTSAGGCHHNRRWLSSIRSSSSTNNNNNNNNNSNHNAFSLEQQSKHVQDALYRIRCVNYMPHDIQKSLIPFLVNGRAFGKVRPSIADLLAGFQMDDGNPVFELTQKSCPDQPQPQPNQVLTLSKHCGSTCEERSAAVAVVTQALRDQGIVRGWRDELYPVATSFYEEPVFLMERAAVHFLGVLEYGVHMNGLVVVQSASPQQPSQQTPPPVLMWMARRSATKSKYPNMLDHLVAGGQPAGVSLMDNVVKECLEEAGIPESITRAGVSSAGVISYETYHEKSDTISRNILFCFDLVLPESFQPVAMDGEVQEFFTWTVDQVFQSMDQDYADPIKPNCYVVIIDWLVRNGHLSPDVPGYLDVVRELRSGDCQ